MKKILLRIAIALVAISMSSCKGMSTKEIHMAISNQSGRVACVAVGTLSKSGMFEYTDSHGLGAGSSCECPMDIPQKDAKLCIIVCKEGYPIQNPDPEEALANQEHQTIYDISTVMDGARLTVIIHPEANQHEVN